MDTEKILVTGGTGMTGRRLTRLLRERGTEARVGSRTGTPRFDWHDQKTWDPVLEGTTAVYLCYHPDLGFPGAGEIVAAFAARAARHGVRRMALLSGRGEPEAQKAELAVGAEFPGLTVLRCAVFAQNFSEGFLHGPVLEGTVALPAPDVPEPFVDLDDVAEVAARVLTEDGHAGELYVLTGPASVTFTEATRLIGEAAGRAVGYQEVSAEEFVSWAAAAGLPEDDARGLAALLGQILDGRNVEPADGVERALGRPATAFAEYVRRAGAWRS
ncbi:MULTISPECIES: NAD-dependent epimerase/dehydratase family protein [unclassified Nocardiopsis]|uniref:NAD-dependent epimerase/dehydratase family protein n=1 Tax=unclassified Nocardiopsis TaxID=2649073 RepID=UPI00135A72A5|nr:MULTISPECIES: NAD-dependent epimerase/dehydratase family protein [unclassified Nocardiopsis]